jgi:hypothetical protein
MDICNIRTSTSDLHGWRKCNRTVGTILAMVVGLKLLLAFSALPTSMVGRQIFAPAISALPPSMVGRQIFAPAISALPPSMVVVFS